MRAVPRPEASCALCCAASGRAALVGFSGRFSKRRPVITNYSLRKAGGNVKLVNVNRRNIELLVMTKLATVFEIFTDEQDAVSSYYPDRKIKTFDILSFVQQMKKEEE